MMESGEPLAGRRSEFMSTRRSSHRVASRTLDLERRLRVLSAYSRASHRTSGPGHGQQSATATATVRTPWLSPIPPYSDQESLCVFCGTAHLRDQMRLEYQGDTSAPRPPRSRSRGAAYLSG
jgi:hypothetical protein